MLSNKKVKKLLFYIGILIICFIMILPVYILLRISFSVPNEVLNQHPKFFIQDITFKHWKQVLQSGNIWKPLEKSLLVATFTMLVSIIIAAPASYSISRINSKKLKYAVILALFFTKMFPNVGIALPISVTFIKWRLTDTTLGLVMAHLIGQLPFVTWILVATFDAIPIDLEEAAFVDGATKIQTLNKVIFPIAMQGVAVSGIYVWLNSWNEFTYSLYLSLSTKTLPLQIYYYVQRGGFFEQAAYSIILAIPVIIITFSLQRYIKSDYLGGAVKG